MTVIAVTVTYGDRFEQLCRPTIESASAAGAAMVVVVDNGSAPASSAALAAFEADREAVIVISNEDNLGSAKAFGQGMRRAVAEGADDVWLLDDDNAVATDLLTTLLRVRDEESVTGGIEVVAAPRRVPNAIQERLINGASVDHSYPAAGAFLGFDAVSFLRARVRRRRAPRERGAAVRPRIPYAPYGGLLVPRSIIERVGYPDPRLQLYVDDTIWTDSIVRSGTPIVLVAEAVIEDADAKWTTSSGGNSIASAVRSPHLGRLYLSTRNRIWFDRRRAEGFGGRLRYGINRAVVLAVAWCSGARAGSFEGFAVLRRAARDGARGDFSHAADL